MGAKIYMRFFLFLCLIAIFANNACAKEAKTITSYLQNLQSVAMDFVQVDSRGAEAVGKLIIVKPHRFRCNYYAPYPLLVLGNKYEIILYDYQLEQTTRIDSKENLFNFLLADTTQWDKDFRMENIIHDNGATLFKLYHYPTERTISVVLQDKPLELKQIIIDEPDGNIIEIIVSKMTNIKDVNLEIFSLRNPNVYGPPTRLDKGDIEKKYVDVK